MSGEQPGYGIVGKLAGGPSVPLAQLAWVGLLGLLLSTWDAGATSLFLLMLVPFHLAATAALADCMPEGIRPGVWAAGRLALVLPVLVGAV
jgi:hypothetical protein